MFMDLDKLKLEDMATVIGIFENQFKNNQPLTVVKTWELKLEDLLILMIL